jgi:hypothetical protein
MEGLEGLLREHVPGLNLVSKSQQSLTRSYAGYNLPFRRRVFVDTESGLARRSPFVRSFIQSQADKLSPPMFPRVANEFERSSKRWLTDRSHPVVQQLLPDLEWADLVIHNAELLNHASNPVSLRGMFLVWFAQHQLGKLAAVVNQTTPSSTGDPVMSGILGLAGPAMDLVTTREPISQRVMEAWGIRSTLVPDPAFSLTERSHDVRGFESWRREVGLTTDPYFCLSLSSGMPLSGSEPNVTRLIQGLQEIVPNAVLMAYGGGVWVLKTAASKRPKSFVFEGSYRQVWPLLQRASFVVSGHYHNLIMAAMAGCPFVPFTGLSHKIEGLLELLRWPYPRTYNLTALEGELAGIHADARRVFQERAALSDHLIARSAELRDLAQMNGRLLQRVISQR